MRIIVLIFLAGMACNNPRAVNNGPEPKADGLFRVIGLDGFNAAYIVTVDSIEYLYIDAAHGAGLTKHRDLRKQKN